MSISGISKTGQGLVDQMFKQDADKNAKLSVTEFKQFSSEKSGTVKPNPAALEAQFKTMDADGDKQLSKAEAQKFFSLPQIETPKLSSSTTSNLLDLLSQENKAAASSTSPVNLLNQLLQNYAKAQNSGSGSGNSSDA